MRRDLTPRKYLPFLEHLPLVGFPRLAFVTRGMLRSSQMETLIS